MNLHYTDILSRIAEPPLWFDEYAVPRFEPFTPDMCADIYAQECALVRIRCQTCAREFDVCMSWSHGDSVIRHTSPLSADIRSDSIGYGDPPNVDCCPAGPTMSSDTIGVLQFWRKGPESRYEWVRDTSLEFGVTSED